MTMQKQFDTPRRALWTSLVTLFLLACVALSGGLALDGGGAAVESDAPVRMSDMAFDGAGFVVAWYQRDPLPVPQSGWDVIWNHMER